MDFIFIDFGTDNAYSAYYAGFAFAYIGFAGNIVKVYEFVAVGCHKSFGTEYNSVFFFVAKGVED